MQALITKAECLYNLCKFEHALVFYSRALRISPKCKKLEKEKEKCEKTILNKLTGTEVFYFKGSERLINYLRDSSNILLNMNKENEKENWQKLFASAACLKNPKERHDQHNSRKKKDTDPLRSDREYLRNLEKTLKPLKGLEKEGYVSLIKHLILI